MFVNCPPHFYVYKKKGITKKQKMNLTFQPSLPPWFSLFCVPGADRLKVLARVLHEASIPFELVKTGRFRHIQVRFQRSRCPQNGEKILLAHYDCVPGSPGANDNGASVLALVEYLLRQPRSLRPLRVIFTDGEELGHGDAPSDQGAYALARSWGPVSGLFPVVFDMTGIGDTLVLGHLGEQLVRQTRAEASPSNLDIYAKLRWGARRWLATCGAGDTLEVNTPFSDDLGLFLAGIPAVQVSLLPRKEALAYRRLRKIPGELIGGLPGALPSAWMTMHTPDDRPENLWSSSRSFLVEILERLENFPLS